mmetsp:Transcript_16047/g.35715  ORF Transcript_16047/g.35715 Transcript_16047/m.35715 type:complete len:445 (+) Transcript_16047:93-1427(+)
MRLSTPSVNSWSPVAPVIAVVLAAASSGAAAVTAVGGRSNADGRSTATNGNRVLQSYTCAMNPCNSASSGSYFAHADVNKYIQCGEVHNGERLCYEMPCGAGTVWNQEVTACVHDCDGGCGNPCANGGFYHEHCDPDKIHQFIQCDEFGGCFVQDCAPGTVWSQRYLTCVNDCSMILGGAPNPCPDALSRGLSAVSYDPDDAKYVQCDDVGGCYIMPCGDDKIWSDMDGQCIDDPNRIVVPPDSGGFVKTCSDNRVYSHDFAGCVKPCRGIPPEAYNPCTYDNVMQGNMFHPHWDESHKYIECYPNGNCFIGDCPEGSRWNQHRELCVDIEYDCRGEGDAIVVREDEENGGGSTGDDQMLRKRRLASSSSSSAKSSKGSEKIAAEANRAWQKGCEDVTVDRANGVKRKGNRSGSGGKGGKSSKGSSSGKGGKGGKGKGGKSSRR